jgi:hypothetical protein
VITACLAKDPARRPGIPALAAMIAQAGPAITAMPTSFWPDQVAEVIRAAQAFPTQVSPAAGSPPQPTVAPLSMAQPGAGQAGSAPPWAGQAGSAPPWAGQAPSVHASPLQDGYLAAATASMAGRGPGAPGGAPGAGAPSLGLTTPAGQGSSWPPAAPGSWPEPSGTDPMARYTPAPRRPRPPTSVLAAGWLMYTGAAVSLLHMLVVLATIGKVTTAFKKSHPLFSASTARSLAAVASVEVLIAGAVVIALWVWLAIASQQGHGWVRTVGTVLFGVATFIGFVVLRIPGIGGVSAIGIVIWLIGLVTVILLWQRRSSEFFAIRR